MTQKERRLFLIQSLLLEQQHDRDIEIPKEDEAQKNLLRSLFNIRMPNPVSKNSWRYKMLICRRKSDERESPNLLICNPFKIILSLAGRYHHPAL